MEPYDDIERLPYLELQKIKLEVTCRNSCLSELSPRTDYWDSIPWAIHPLVVGTLVRPLL